MKRHEFIGCDFRICLSLLLYYDNLPLVTAKSVRRAVQDELKDTVVHAHVDAEVDLTALENDDDVQLFIQPGTVALYRTDGHGTELKTVAVATWRVCNSDQRTLRRIDVYFNPFIR